MKPIDLRRTARTTCPGRFRSVHPGNSRDWLTTPERPPTRRTVSKRLLGWLFRNLSRNFRQIDGQVISDAVRRACLGHRRNPMAFKASCGVPLDYYLLFTAARHLGALLGTGQRSRN